MFDYNSLKVTALSFTEINDDTAQQMHYGIGNMSSY